MSGPQGLLRALWRVFSNEVKQHVGTDQFGNKYYYIPQRKNWLGQTLRERRVIETNMKEVDYKEGDIPSEWEAWIRKTRKTPPSIEEIMKNQKYREDIKMKIKDISEKEKLLNISDNKEKLVDSPVQIQIKGHASAPDFGKSHPSEDPTSTGKTFQPGSWLPQESSNQNK
ncbi:NADH dehydrogenase [ubiquinone] 1 alpha subcomplex assembly factor 2 isoform X1 [Monodelphis domestica]|uniref:NADH:ubiquinone oxidoreductase complex assembly factor 2 n=1 Tax=Monodelphis domestica TaxID=13616 RepID=F6QM58_MONDO|nr:NADH dehydrogenase [ubiquinone] 1 alpha subcomplex assembly factor 2 isoform X1 [Monodelphis domestica]